MDGREFLTLAQALATEATEVAWRTAASRAYYAAFHVARTLMQDLGFTVPHGDRAHAHLWLRLSNAGDAQVEQAGADLNALRRDRNRADYDLGPTFPHLVVAAAVQAAAWIIQTLDAASAEPTRTQITDAMRIYERDVLHDVTWHP
jgi:uncharacterized protein (UPF0332 family)